MVVTNLVPIIGYDKASEIARRARRTGKTIKHTILEMGLKMGGNLDELLDPRDALTPSKRVFYLALKDRPH